LAEALALSSLLDELAHIEGNLVVAQLLGLAVQFGSVLGGHMLLVGASTICT